MVSRFSHLWALGLAAALLWAVPVPAGANPEPAALWNALGQPVFDTTKVAVVEHVELQRDVATLTLVSGRLALGRLSVPEGEERVFAAAFKGMGRLRFAPTLAMEKQQLAFHSGQEALETEFTEAVFVFTDATVEDLSQQLSFAAGEPSDLQSLYQDRNKRWTKYGLNWEPRLLKALLAGESTFQGLFVAELNTRAHDWLTLVVDARDPEEVELQQFDSGRHALSVWSKFPAGGRRPAEAFADPLAHHDYRLQRYALDVTIAGREELQGQAEVELVVRRAGERVLLLALDPHLRVRQVTDGAGGPLSFFQPENPKDDFFLGDYLVVVAGEAFPLGANELRFGYEGRDVVRKVGEGNFFCQSFGWYPTYGVGRYSLSTNTFAARSDFDLTLRVQDKYQAVATGEKVEERKEDKYQVTRWRSEIPLAVAGFAFGEYKIHTAKIGDTEVEIYANKRSDSRLRQIELMAGGVHPDLPLPDPRNPVIYNDSVEMSVPAALESLAPARLVKEMATEVGNSLQVMEKYFGPYPYKKLAVSNIPYSYGQGWPSLLYISTLSFLDSTQRNALGIDDHVEITDSFRAHETSHQWWGHAVSWKSYHDQWLSEGFAEFSGILYTLYGRNQAEYSRLLRENREQLLVGDQEGATYEQIGPLYAGRRLSSAKHPGGYSRVVYLKGGWVLHMLRMMLYDPRNRENSDAAFIAMMKDFTRTYHNQPASTEDFKAIVEKHMTPAMNMDGNGKMDWFFDSWVYGTGIPVYDLRYSIEPGPEAGQFALRGALRQSGVPADFRMIVPLFLHKPEGFMRVGWLNVRGPETPFEVMLPFEPTKVTINEWEDVLAIVK